MNFHQGPFGHIEYRVDGRDPRPAARALAAIQLAAWEQRWHRRRIRR